MAHHHQVYSASGARFLTGRLRRLLLDPHAILSRYVKPGMTVLDVGCGPGFFTIPAARLVGAQGGVIAADLQRAMLDQLKASLKGSQLSSRIVLHQCGTDRVGVAGPVDLVLALNVIHELPGSARFFAEMQSVMKPGGTVLVMEPALVVSAREFSEELGNAARAGFVMVEKRRTVLSRRAVVRRG